MDIKINIVEAASELAQLDLEENWSKSIKIYNEDDDSETSYTEEAQNIFDNLYDKYYDFLDCRKINENEKEIV